jgi:uncharacterized OB-fold protein
MAYFPDDMPAPQPTADEAGFWEQCQEHRLSFQACVDCSELRHPPSPICPNCHSVRLRWVQAPAEAQVYTFNVVRHAGHPAVVSRLPYVVAVVEFPGLPGVRLITNVTDIDPSQVRIGMPVSLWWDELATGEQVPRFRPAAEPNSAKRT